MKKMMKYFTPFCFALCGLGMHATADTAVPAFEETADFVYPGAKVHQYYSQIVDQQYEVRIRLPGGYEQDSEAQYPVIYVLDGQWHFTSSADVLGSLTYDGQTPNSIIAAITWSGEGAVPDQLRWRDFTYTPIPNQPLSGGADLFLQALEGELIPFVESKYRANEHRTLIGSSLGGLFATIALLEKPSLFDGYVALSAPYVAEYAYFQAKLAELGGTKVLKGKRLFLGVGGLEFNKPLVIDFSQQLKGAGLKGLRVKTKVVNNVGHAGINAPGFTYGLQHVFKRSRVKLDEAVVSNYAGNYIIHPSLPPLVISFDNNKLLLNQVGAPTISFYASSETEFYYEGANISLEFIEQVEGPLIMAISQEGQVFELLKEG